MNSGKQDRNGQVQGEGNVEADRRYRSDVREYVQNNDIEQAARDAEPSSAAEAEAMRTAEQKGRERSRGDDQADVMKTEEQDTAADDLP